MYALDTISFPGFCGSYKEIQGWSQSHYVDFIVKHHMHESLLSNPSSTHLWCDSHANIDFQPHKTCPMVVNHFTRFISILYIDTCILVEKTHRMAGIVTLKEMNG